MTSRRSRLKAVANLPVRRKAPAPIGTTNEIPVNDNPEKILTKGDEAVKNQTYETDLSYDTSISNKNEISLKCNGDYISSTADILTPSDCNTIENSNNLLQNCNASFGSNFSDSNSNNPDSYNKENTQVLNQNVETISLYKDTISDITFNNNNINQDSINDNVKCYTVLSPQNITDGSISTYTISTLTPCDVDDSTEPELYSLSQTQDFEEVQIYTEVVEPSEFFVGLPKFISNDISEKEVIVESEEPEPEQEPEPEPEPTLTPLVNCSKNDVKKLVKSAYGESNLNSKNAILRSNPKSYSKYEKCKIKDESRTLLGKNPSPEDLALEYDGHDAIFIKSITRVSRKRPKCNDITKKLADAKREFQKKFERARPNRSTLKMIDLIYYNPSTNPMESKTKYDKKETNFGQGDVIQEILSEERVDEPESMDSGIGSQGMDKDTENCKMPVPQVKIGLNGEIILDEKSLVIETTDARKGREDLQNSVPVFEDRRARVSYYRGKTKKTRDWTDFETKRFYKALNTIGPDFSLMQKYFPKRSRLELKNKFKREERLNRHLIDKALNNPSEFDMTHLEKDLDIQRRAEEEAIEMRLRRKRKLNMRRKVKKPRQKSSALSRELVESDVDSVDGQYEPNTKSVKAISQSEKEKKKNEINFIFQKMLNRNIEK